ncbi:hypothetical protein BKA81DRAFT_80653 [Phyllosticta paracitricarpa]
MFRQFLSARNRPLRRVEDNIGQGSRYPRVLSCRSILQLRMPGRLTCRDFCLEPTRRASSTGKKTDAESRCHGIESWQRGAPRGRGSGGEEENKAKIETVSMPQEWIYPSARRLEWNKLRRRLCGLGRIQVSPARPNPALQGSTVQTGRPWSACLVSCPRPCC